MPSQTTLENEQDLKQYAERVEDSPSEALEAIKNQIAWLEYVPDGEYSKGDRQRVLDACQDFFRSIRPLTRKYID
jgi:hypothetical protein